MFATVAGPMSAVLKVVIKPIIAIMPLDATGYWANMVAAVAHEVPFNAAPSGLMPSAIIAVMPLDAAVHRPVMAATVAPEVPVNATISRFMPIAVTASVSLNAAVHCAMHAAVAREVSF